MRGNPSARTSSTSSRLSSALAGAVVTTHAINASAVVNAGNQGSLFHFINSDLDVSDAHHEVEAGSDTQASQDHENAHKSWLEQVLEISWIDELEEQRQKHWQPRHQVR